MAEIYHAESLNRDDLSGQDLSQLSEEKNAKLRMLGIDPNALAAAQGSPVAPSPDDDRVSKLERLAQLRDSGAPSDAEFEAEKKKVIERYRHTSVHPEVYNLAMARTNIDVDDDLLQRAMQLYGVRTKREAVDLALRRLVGAGDRLGILKLRGSGWEGDLDPMRRGRVFEHP